MKIIRETFVFYALLSISPLNKVNAGSVRQVVILYSNDFMEIGLGELSIGGLRQVVVLWRLCLSRFDVMF